MNIFKKIFNRKEKVRKEVNDTTKNVSLFEAPLDVSWKADATSFDDGDYTAEIVEKLPFKEEDGRVYFNQKTGSCHMLVNVKNREGKAQSVDFELDYSSIGTEDYTAERLSLKCAIKDEKNEVIVDENGQEFSKYVCEGRNYWGCDLLGDTRKLLAGMVSKKRGGSSAHEEHFEGLVKFAARTLDDRLALEEDHVRELVKQRNEKELREQMVAREAFSRF